MRALEDFFTLITRYNEKSADSGALPPPNRSCGCKYVDLTPIACAVQLLSDMLIVMPDSGALPPNRSRRCKYVGLTPIACAVQLLSDMLIVMPNSSQLLQC